jgi:hypothetical protein
VSSRSPLKTEEPASGLELRPLTLEHRALMDGYLRRSPPEISEHTFSNLFVWRGKRPIWIAEWREALLVIAELQGKRRLLGPPIGEFDAEALPGLLARSDIHVISRLPEGPARGVERAGMKVAEDRDNADYVYLREDLAGLHGRHYHRQKNLVNKCLSNFDCQWVEVTPALLDEVADMQKRWCDEKDCDNNPSICAENNAIRQALKHFAELDLVGGAVRVGAPGRGRIEAYSLAGRLTDETAVVHFEKAMTTFPGLYQVVNKWFCERALSGYRFVNREQDMGIPGLRKAKMSYRPHHMVDKYMATLAPEAAARLVGGDTEGRCREQ